MVGLVQSDQVGLLGVLPRSARVLEATWTELQQDSGTANEAQALTAWVLVIDYLLDGEPFGIVTPSGVIAPAVDRALSIASFTSVIQERLARATADSPVAEMAWGGPLEPAEPVWLRAGVTLQGTCTLRYRASSISDHGAEILSKLWSAALTAAPSTVIGDIRWQDAVAQSVNQNRQSQRPNALDIPSHFDRVVARVPGNTAVVEATRTWSYRELDAFAQKITASLLDRGTKPGEIVAMALPRGGKAVAAMLGILRAGAAYLPVDLDDPPERLKYVFEDAGVRSIISEFASAKACASYQLSLLDIDNVPSAKSAPLPRVTGQTSAYVMYTSGSTGQPKGVEVRHQGVTRLVVDCSFMRLDDETAMLHAAPLGFDASTLEVWGPLLNGGRCIIHDEVIPTGQGLAASIETGGARAAWLTAALFNAVVDDEPKNLAGLDTLLIGGEALSVAHVKKFLAAAPRTRLINGYGPTETTTFAATHPIKLDEVADAASVPVGLPINATAHYVLNKSGAPVPRGVVGELFIGGLGVARGYVGRAELTAERFLADPFAGDGSSMYRTGDHVRMTADGTLEFFGRIDGQVKIRGFRIETGEIEAALSRCAGVKSCAVIAHRDSVRGAELVAYVVPSIDEFSPAALKFQLAKSLPDFMVPAQWMKLDALPVTANGKLDRRALPSPLRERPSDFSQRYVEPSPGAERDVAHAMARALGIDRVGALDNFFDLGGNSLLVVKAHAALRDAGHAGVSVAHFFANPTPRAIATLLQRSPSAPRTQAKDQAANDDPIAVIGMAGRFPGANDIDAFWQMLRDGRETIRFFTPEELDASIPDALRMDDRYVAARGVISGTEMFDAAFFGISPREAELMDPQQRLFLEIAWECLESAGHVPEKTAAPIGVFAGMYNATYFANHLRAHPDKIARLGEFLVMLGNEKDYIATRTAHKLGLTGPAVCVQTACSTSLVAIAQAFDALRARQCGLALAGGASITCPPDSGYLYQEGAMLSPDGHTRTFDVNAQGTVFSDGAAVVLLKRLSDAVADGNTIYAVIRSVSVNNDGADKASFTAPSVEGQATLVRAALERANIDARSIDYVEAHGTATPLGDPIEVAALTEAYRDHTSDVGFCRIGSLKSNTGHMVIAAGAAGLMKTALSLHNELLPPTLHYTGPNPKIDFAGSPFVVNGTLKAWPRSERPRRAGVSSFGVGGTNAHAILEEAPLSEPSAAIDGPHVLRLSARTPAALTSALERLAGHLERDPNVNLADVAHTLDVGRRDFTHRATVVAESAIEAAAALRERAKAKSGATQATDHQLVMMFPGQGAQYAGMGRDLYAKNTEFKRSLDTCFDAIASHVDFDLRERMFSDDAAALAQTAITQPATFALEYALSSVWLARGVKPAAFVGHSVGEFVAATHAGVLRLEDAVKLVARRGALMQSMPAGAMLSVRMTAAEVEPYLSDAIQLAAENGPSASVVAGPIPDIEALAARLEAQGAASRRLQTSHAFHSAMMDPAVPALEELARSVRLSAPQMQIASTLTGRWLNAAEATDPGYWSRHMRQPVRFSAAIRHLISEFQNPLFLEAGPGTALCSFVRQHRKANAVPAALSSLSNDAAREERLVAEAAGQLWSAGHTIETSAHDGRRRIVLPTYPFERQRHWVETLSRSVQAPVANLPAQQSEPIAIPAVKALPPEPVASPAAIASPEPSPVQATSIMSTNATTPRQPRLVQRLRAVFEDVSGIELEDADPAASFVELGLDSLTLTQVALQVKKEFSVPVTFRQLMESFRSFDDLASHLDAQLPPEAAPPAAPEPVAAAAPAPQPPQLQVQAQPIAQALPAPVVSYAVQPAGGDMSVLQQLVSQQMALMQQQLALLQGQPMQQVAAPLQAASAAVAPQQPAATAPSAAAASAKVEAAPAATPAAAAPAAAAISDEAALEHKTYDVKKAFGAIARIHTSGNEMSERQRTRLDAFMKRYIEKTQRSKAFTTEHRPHLADPRVVNGFRPQLKEIIYQIVIERSKGARVWDIDGNAYIDALNGFGMSMFGWQPDFVLDAVRKQLDDGYEIGPQHPLAGPVSKLICELTGFDRAGLCNTGSEAVMGCVRIARTVTGRSKIAIFTGAYHGIFDEVIVRGTKKGKAVPAAPGIMKNTAENVVVLDYATPETLQWLKDNANDLAAVLVEPVQSRRPDLQPREFLHELRALTEANGALLIFDEVVTGFRSHPGGAQAIFGVRADLASYGKVVGGGFPIGVIAGKREYMDALDGGHWDFGDASIPTVGVTYFAGTFVRHPLALAAAHAVLEHCKSAGPKMQEELTGNVAAMIDELNAYCREVGAPITLKHFSSVWKVFFDEDHPFQDLLFAMMRNRGIHILDNFPCFMTTAHDAEAIGAIKTAFKEAVAEMQQSDFLPKRLTATVLSFDASRPPVPGARLGRDAEGKPAWFVANPEAPGKYIKVESQ